MDQFKVCFISRLIHLETPGNLSDKYLALFFCEVVRSAGSSDIKQSRDWEVERAGRTW